MKNRCRGVKSGSRRSEELANARNEDCALRAQNEELALLVERRGGLLIHPHINRALGKERII